MYKRKAVALADDLRKVFGKITIDLNPAAPRRGSFECKLLSGDDDSEILIWTGIKKGPPRKLKFPETPDKIIEDLKKHLKM